jgi:hypothetical protein
VTRRQCSKCPWRVDVDPRMIPRGYSEEKHRGLANTIAQPGQLPGKDTLPPPEAGHGPT